MTMRSLLFVPADSERKLQKGLASDADALILDLEDSVSLPNKPAARKLASEVLKSKTVDGPKLIVRVNALSSGLTADDVEAIAPYGPDAIMQPKTEGPSDIRTLVNMLPAPRPIYAIATETAKAMFSLSGYGEVAPPLAGVAWGAEDLSSELGAVASRDDRGDLTAPYQLARTLCLLAARAADVEPIDTVFVNFRDTAGLEAECMAAVRDGFTCKMAIHPDQVELINRHFTPSAEMIADAQKVVDAFGKSEDRGVVAIDGTMFDIPHLKRAERLLARARAEK